MLLLADQINLCFILVSIFNPAICVFLCLRNVLRPKVLAAFWRWFYKWSLLSHSSFFFSCLTIPPHASGFSYSDLWPFAALSQPVLASSSSSGNITQVFSCPPFSCLSAVISIHLCVFCQTDRPSCYRQARSVVSLCGNACLCWSDRIWVMTRTVSSQLDIYICCVIPTLPGSCCHGNHWKFWFSCCELRQWKKPQKTWKMSFQRTIKETVCQC